MAEWCEGVVLDPGLTTEVLSGVGEDVGVLLVAERLLVSKWGEEA